MEHILISTSISEETLETDNNNKYINYILLNYGSIPSTYYWLTSGFYYQG